MKKFEKKTQLMEEMIEHSRHYLSFIWELDIDEKEKAIIINQMLALTLKYRLWDPIKQGDFIKERKSLIRSAKDYQAKKIKTMKEIITYLTSPHPITKEKDIISDNAITELMITLARWENFDASAMIDSSLDNGDMLKKPNLDAIKLKLEEIHDKYSIQHKTDNIQEYIASLKYNEDDITTLPTLPLI